MKMKILFSAIFFFGEKFTENKIFVFIFTTCPKYFLEWEIFRTSCRENKNENFVFSKFFPRKNRVVCEIMWKDRARQATDDNMTHALFMLDN